MASSSLAVSQPGLLGSVARGFASTNQSRVKKVLIWVAITVIYFTRIAFLDCDVAPWGMVTYQPVDEGIYSALAINAYNLGVLDPSQYFESNYSIVYLQQMVNLPLQALVYLGLVLLGDNYFGFRIGSVIMGYACIVLIFCTTKALFKKSLTLRPYADLAGFVSVALLIFCFPFYNATRIVESSLSRALIVLLLAFICTTSKLDIRLKSFFIGFLVIISIFLVYITNVFMGIMLLGYLVTLVATKRYKEAALYALYCSIGAILAYLIALLYFQLVWNMTPVANILATMSAFTKASTSDMARYGSSYSVASLLGYLQNGQYILSANVILYDFPLVGLFCLLCPALFRKKLAGIRDEKICLLLLGGGYLLQTLILSDFVTRKEIIIYPVFVVLLVAAFFSAISDEEGHQSVRGWKLVVGIIVAGAWSLFVAIYRLYIVHESFATHVDFDSSVANTTMLVVCVYVVGIVVFGIALLIFSKKKALIVAVSVFSLVLSVVFNVCLIAKYCFVDVTYSDKEAMIEIGEIADGKVVCGTYFYGFTLYNDAIPMSNDRNVLIAYMAEDPDSYYLDYAGAEDFTECPIDAWQTFSTVKVFHRDYVSRYAESNRDIALYVSDYEGQ